MKKKIFQWLLILMLFIPAGAMAAANDVLILCYHDIPKEVKLDPYGVDQASFVEQIEYLRNHGYNFVSMEQIIEASRGGKQLPDKAVLLTFDDAYLSFYEFVAPILKLYGYPCVLAVVSDWIDNPNPEIKQPLMNWSQIQEVSRSDLVEVASHTDKLHRAIIYNPQGNTAWATASRYYNKQNNSYENDTEFRRRLNRDLQYSKNRLFQKTGKYPRVLVWPYGKYNQLGVEEAKRVGFVACFSLEDQIANTEDIYALPRCILSENPSMEEFIKALKDNFKEEIKLRVIQADLDLIYDSDPKVQEANLDKFIERIYSIKPNVVYLQAFCDDEGTGNISSVYFPNRILPMKADIFNRVVNQLDIRDIQVYAWMPMLSIVLSDEAQNQKLRVKEYTESGIQPSAASYKRLSPFNAEVVENIKMLYEDMAANARISGVVFLDDGYLNDFEDFNEAAVPDYVKISGNKDLSPAKLTQEQQDSWTELKTMKLIELTDKLKKCVRKYRPYAFFSRTLYAEVIMDPDSQEWYAQSFPESLKAYDYVNVMAYPRMEKVKDAKSWFVEMVDKVKEYPDGLDKTVFKVQAYDWSKDKWIDSHTVYQWLSELVSLGARHIGYYPDDFTKDKPEAAKIRLIMSCEDFPFKRKLFMRDSVVMQ